ncbi:MAG: solute-binding protein [Anaerolineae bacterium]|nr:solute-binding protein [Anaerolineae bacterium]
MREFQIRIPDELNLIAAYPRAAIADSRNPEWTQAFVECVLSTDGQAVLAKYGFTTVTVK